MSKCKIWPHAKDAYGYGVKRVGKQTLHIGRIVLKNKLGRPIKRGMMALHTCHNPPCYNEDHLYEGTRLDNARDAKLAGRTARGERHGRSKLTEKQVRQIKKLLGKVTQTELGRRYGVRQQTISMIATNTNWPWL